MTGFGRSQRFFRGPVPGAAPGAHFDKYQLVTILSYDVDFSPGTAVVSLHDHVALFRKKCWANSSPRVPRLVLDVGIVMASNQASGPGMEAVSHWREGPAVYCKGNQ